MKNQKNFSTKKNVFRITIMLVLLLTVLGGMPSRVSAEDGPPQFPMHPKRDDISTQDTTPTFSVYYEYEDDAVVGWDWPLGSSITMTIDNPNNGSGVDFTATETAVSYSGSSDTVVYFYGYGYDIQPNYIVTLTDGSTTKTHIVANLQINSITYSSDTVSGSVTTSSAVINVTVCLYSGGCYYQYVAPDGSGNWTADFSGTVDFKLGDYILAYQNDADYDDTSVYVQTITFGDVMPDDWAFEYIEAFYSHGITTGCAPYYYCPDKNVTRAEMAVFIERATGTFTPPTVSLTFTDTSAHWAKYWIEKFRADGITTGCGSNVYCPDQNVTRAEMAVFIERATGTSTPPTVSLTFTDTSAHWAKYWIEKFRSDGITTGCGTNIYCPDQYVTRREMAVFISRAFGYTIGE